MNNSDFSNHPSLLRFAESSLIKDRADAIRNLFSERIFLKVTKTDLFATGLRGLINSFQTYSSDVDRLASLVELVRIWQSAPKLMCKEIQAQVSPYLETRLPSVNLLEDANDRAYIAKACHWSKGYWVLDYAIQGMVTEETAEIARVEFGKVVFARADTLSEIFVKLLKALRSLHWNTEFPSDSLATRLARIIPILRTNIVSSLLPAGEAPGENLSAMIRIPISEVGSSAKEDRQILLAKEIILCSYDIVRTRFSLSIDEDTYLPLKAAKRLFTEKKWPEQLKDELNRVANSILEALLLLGKQGVASPALVEHLELVVDNKLRADNLLRNLVESNPGLDDSIRSWLLKKKLIHSNEIRSTLIESQELRSDPIIGQALIESIRISEVLSNVNEQVLPTIELYDPQLAKLIHNSNQRTQGLINIIDELSRRRKIGLLGRVGNVIDYTPRFFDIVEGPALSIVRVVKSAVVRLDQDGIAGEVVVKGLVENQ